MRVLIFLVLLPFFGYGQDKVAEYPKDEKGNIQYQNVVDLEGYSSEKIYDKALLYFIENYNSGKDVLQLQDKEGRILVGNGVKVMNSSTPTNKYPVIINLGYTLKVECKENKYRYTLFSVKWADIPYNGVLQEEVMTMTKNKKTQTEIIYSTIAIERELVNIIEQFEKYMSTEKNDDW